MTTKAVSVLFGLALLLGFIVSELAGATIARQVVCRSPISIHHVYSASWCDPAR